MLKDFKPRLYQETILSTAVQNNTLVVLPTGMGKTAVSMMLAVQRIKQYPKSKILILAPTRPLVDQHIQTFDRYMDINKQEMNVFTGMIKPDKRAELWKSSRIIFSTPQGLENDIISKRVDLKEVSLIVFDEAHRATGDYSYVFVAKQYNKLARFPKILALTASPGSDIEKIQEIIKNLYIEEVEVRTDNDPDVKPYIKEIDMSYVKVDLSKDLLDIQKHLKDFIKSRLEKLKSSGILKRKDISFISKTDLLQLQSQVRGQAFAAKNDFVLWNGVSILAEIMKVQHGLELLETQGIFALNEYLEKIRDEGSKGKTKAVKNIVNDINFRSAVIKAESMQDKKVSHPKMIELKKIVKSKLSDNPNYKMIIFNQYRDNAQNIVEELNSIGQCKAKLFVGQSKKKETGLSQKLQKEMLDKFRQGEFNVLVATSVGEEGLDIPKVDLVIFYEPIPSAIRTIQRRGRTGRLDKGQVIILMTKKTRDEGYRWSAHHKEKRMYRTLDDLKSKLQFKNKEQSTIQDYGKKECKEENGVKSEQGCDKKIKIFVDHREKGSKLVKEFVDQDIDIKLEQLKNSDYILSSSCGVEFKTKEDFVQSIIDGRLLEQVKQIKNNFDKPVVLVQGEEDIYSLRNIHPNAINGMIATIVVSYGVPLLFTKDAKESSQIMLSIAKREQDENFNSFTPHFSKKAVSLKDKQEYVVSSFPGIGTGLAKDMLRKFKNIKSIVNSSEDVLKDVEKIGDKKARDLKDVFEKDYMED